MTDEWDIFISYAHRDEDWVNGVLCHELLRRSVHGRSPRVFVDNSPDGLQPGSSWPQALAYAVEHSKFFVSVYSAHYFASAVCRREMALALVAHAEDDGIIPLLIDPSAEIPFAYSPIHFLPTSRADWLERLCHSLGLTGLRIRPRLRFRGAIDDIRINHTLPEQQVELIGYAPGQGEEDITLDTAPAAGLLRGTLKVTTSGGVAVFRDLSVATPSANVRLVARYPGGDPAESSTFTARGGGSRRAGHLEPAASFWFGADSRTVLALDGLRFDDVPKQYLRWDDRIAVAGWAGLVAVVRNDGGGETYRLGDGLAVPGGLCLIGDRLYIGMWNGQVWSVERGGSRPDPVLSHPAGVQTMAAVGDRLLIVGFDGAVAWYTTDGEPETRAAHRLEPVVWGLQVRPGCVIAVGAERVHRLDLTTDTVIALRLLPTAASGAVIGAELAAVYDSDGHGIRFDSELEVRGAFRSPAGARPVDMDDSGNVLLTADPHGSCALLVDDRVVHVNQDGALAIAPDGTRVALREENGIATFLLADLPGQ